MSDKAWGARGRNHSTEKVWYEFSIYVKFVILLFSLTSRGRDLIMYIAGIACLSDTWHKFCAKLFIASKQDHANYHKLLCTQSQCKMKNSTKTFSAQQQ